MKMLEDNKTIDMLGEPKRGRGRPKTGTAMSNAERQRVYREKRAAAGRGFLTVSLPVDLIEALDKFIQFKDLNKDDVLEKLIRNQVLRKR